MAELFKRENKLKWAIGTVIVPIIVGIISAAGLNITDWLFPKKAPSIDLLDSAKLSERITRNENQIAVLISLLRGSIKIPEKGTAEPKKEIREPIIKGPVPPPPPPGPRRLNIESIKVSNSSVYLGRKVYVGRRAWKWTIYITGDETTLRAIQSVTYTLHPTFRNPVRNVDKLGDINKAFPYTTSGWGTFTVKVLISFDNSFELRKEHQLVFVSGEKS